jgi:hypothetical protein
MLCQSQRTESPLPRTKGEWKEKDESKIFSIGIDHLSILEGKDKSLCQVEHRENTIHCFGKEWENNDRVRLNIVDQIDSKDKDRMPMKMDSWLENKNLLVVQRRIMMGHEEYGLDETQEDDRREPNSSRQQSMIVLLRDMFGKARREWRKDDEHREEKSD